METSNIQHNGKLDIGCGKFKREGFTGVDQYAMDGVDCVFDLRQTWPVESDSVEEVFCSHFVEHLTGKERVVFYNELCRVMKTGAKATIITPHWASNRAYGDFTHQWPPVSEMSFSYLSKEWRKARAPHTDVGWNAEGYSCDFQATLGYRLDPAITDKTQEFQRFAAGNYKDVITDMHCVLVKI